MSLRQQRCRWCQTAIRWANTEKGRSMPLDMHTHPEGNIELIDGIAYVVGQSDDPADVRHISHFATCPNIPTRRKRSR